MTSTDSTPSDSQPRDTRQPRESHLRRRTLVGAAAWSAPAIALSVASPAHAASTPKLGVITLTSTPGDIPQGEQRAATGTLTPPPGVALPAMVMLASSATAVATVPTTVPVAANGTFSIPVTAVAASGASTVTVSAAGYASVAFVASAAAAAAPVWFASNGFYYLVPALGYRLVSWDQGPVRSTDALGVITDRYSGARYENVADRLLVPGVNTLTVAGHQGIPDVRYVMLVRTSGGDRLVWNDSKKPIGNSLFPANQTGKGGMAIYGELAYDPIVRQTTTTTLRPGGVATFIFTFPDYPKYRAEFVMDY